MGIEIKGVEELNKNLEIFKQEAAALLARAVFNGCVLVQNDAKEGHGFEAHSSGRYQDRTTNLTNSIQAQKPKISGTRIRCETVAGIEYAAVVELGGTHTSKSGKTWQTKPYPFMFPALEKSRNVIVESVTSLLKSIRWIK